MSVLLIFLHCRVKVHSVPIQRFQRRDMAIHQELDTDALVRRLRELPRKPKGIKRRAVLLVMLHPLAALGHGRNMPGWNPPEAIAGLLHLFKPLGAFAEYLRVI